MALTPSPVQLQPGVSLAQKAAEQNGQTDANRALRDQIRAQYHFNPEMYFEGDPAGIRELARELAQRDAERAIQHLQRSGSQEEQRTLARYAEGDSLAPQVPGGEHPELDDIYREEFARILRKRMPEQFGQDAPRAFTSPAPSLRLHQKEGEAPRSMSTQERLLALIDRSEDERGGTSGWDREASRRRKLALLEEAEEGTPDGFGQPTSPLPAPAPRGPVRR